MIRAAFTRHEKQLHGRTTELVAGLWTRAHGFVHTGQMTLSLSDPYASTVSMLATGMHNLVDGSWQGPHAGASWLATHQRPVRVALDRWPFT